MSTGNADKYAKIGGGNTDTLTRNAIGNSGGTPSSPPYPPGSNGQTIASEPLLLVEPYINTNVPAPPP